MAPLVPHLSLTIGRAEPVAVSPLDPALRLVLLRHQILSAFSHIGTTRHRYERSAAEGSLALDSPRCVSYAFFIRSIFGWY